VAVAVKICGVNARAAAEAAGAAEYAGFVFYPPSPRAVSPAEAAALAALLPEAVKRVGLFVDADDATIAATLEAVKLDLLQLHGREAPARAAAIRACFGIPVMKAIPIATAEDVAAAGDYAQAADRLLFDARPPKRPGALPGGNATAFDWTLLRGQSIALPWLLSGGLTPDTVGEAIRITGATAVDVSSGVEDAPGRKSPARIAAFIAAARSA
jgi:phosphoribosylanthranilate isomerase